MPIVPRYNRQVEEQATPGVRIQPTASLDTFGSGQANERVNAELDRLNNSVQTIAQEQMDRADDAATTEAYTKLLKAKQDMLYNPDTGAFTKKGKDAFGVSEEFGKRYEQVSESIASSLGNARQRSIFARMKEKEGLELSGHLQRHTLQEAERYEMETTNSAVEVLQNEAALNPAKATDAITLMQGKIQDFADKTGKSPEWAIEKLQTETSKANSGVVSSLLGNKQYGLANSYFKENIDGFLPQDRDRIRAALEEGGRREFGEFKAAQLMSKGVTIENLQEELDKIGDVAKRDETKRRFLDRLELKSAADKAAHMQNFEAAFKSAVNAGTTDAVNPEVWNTFSKKERDAIEEEVYDRQQGIPAGTDWGTKAYLADLAANNPKKFLDENPILHFKNLSESDRNWLINLRGDIQKSGKSAALDDYRTEQSIVTRSLDESGLKKISGKERSLFEDQLAAAQRSAQESLGRKLTNDEFQKIVDNQLMKVTTGSFGPLKFRSRRFELQPGEAGSVDDVGMIPERTVREIKDSLFRLKGIKDPSDETILRVYRGAYGAN